MRLLGCLRLGIQLRYRAGERVNRIVVKELGNENAIMGEWAMVGRA